MRINNLEINNFTEFSTIKFTEFDFNGSKLKFNNLNMAIS
jgi:hypothetical protein